MGPSDDDEWYSVLVRPLLRLYGLELELDNASERIMLLTFYRTVIGNANNTR